MRVGADDGDVFVFGGGERKKIVLVLQQHDRFARGLQREFLMFGAVGDFFGVGGIDIGIIEKAGEKFCAEHARDGAIDRRLRRPCRCAPAERDRPIGVWRRATRCPRRRREPCARRLPYSRRRDGRANEFGDAEIIGDDDAVESPLVAQNVE